MSFLEIERKFLIKESITIETLLDTIPLPYEAFELEQGYLVATEAKSERVRRDGDKYVHTIKERIDELRRIEEDKEITQEEYDALLPKSIGVITKTRYRVKDTRFHELCIDVFHQPVQFIMAELEYNKEEDIGAISIPEWLHESMEREVTDDKRYVNAYIALHGGFGD